MFKLMTAIFLLFVGLACNADDSQNTSDVGACGFASTMQLVFLAGSIGGPGNIDGLGTAARFDSPEDLAIDIDGNIYVADTGNHTIRKIAPSGLVTTWAGVAGQKGSSDGMGDTARFDTPTSLAVDGNGNVYVADTGNHTIRKIAPSGQVITWAGAAGQTGSVDGIGEAARFTAPSGMAVDNGGHLYVADADNHTIRKISPAGEVTTLAGLAGRSGASDGVGIAARFKFPSDVDIDANFHAE